MKISIIGKNVRVTPGIKSAIEKKFSKFNKYFDRDDVSGRVLIRTYPVGKKLEITIFTPKMIFRAEAVDHDLYNAMDIASEKLEGQMRKLKTRITKKQKRQSIAESIYLEKIKAEKLKREDEELVRTKSIYLEPMTVDEAIARMDAIDHDFFLYLDVDENKISVVYRRVDGGFGLLEADNKIK
ncbi:MAG: ribosome-associated translation inhibitor RaiA [Bacilli bacterium]|nr:ribosome-associated translation inhibitor RaiA [Bacilli bacterium]